MTSDPVSFATVILKKVGSYPASDPRWTCFVQDRLALLRSTSTKRNLSLAEMQSYRFRLLELLSTLGYDNSVLWIVMLLNSLKDDSEFDGVSSLMLPDLDTLNEIYVSYTSFITAAAAADAKLNE